MQVNAAPIAVPDNGVLQLPLAVDLAEPHDIGASCQRTSYFAGCPVPSSTWVNVNVIEVLSVEATAKSVTVPGLETAAAAIVPTLMVPVAMIAPVLALI